MLLGLTLKKKLGLCGVIQTWVWESILCEHHEVCINDQSMMSFCPSLGNGQPKSYCTKILTNFVNRNSHVQVVTNASYGDEENDIKNWIVVEYTQNSLKTCLRQPLCMWLQKVM